MNVVLRLTVLKEGRAKGTLAESPFLLEHGGEILQLSQLRSNQGTTHRHRDARLNGAPELCGSANSYREETRVVCM